MKYKVVARDSWSSVLAARFGEYGSFHELTDAQVVEAIRQFGRAEIRDLWYLDRNGTKVGHLVLDFHNDYD